mgnify:CR=1 FL=1
MRLAMNFFRAAKIAVRWNRIEGIDLAKLAEANSRFVTSIASVVLHEPIFARDADDGAEPLEKANPRFAEMMADRAVVRFIGSGWSGSHPSHKPHAPSPRRNGAELSPGAAFVGDRGDLAGYPAHSRGGGRHRARSKRGARPAQADDQRCRAPGSCARPPSPRARAEAGIA